MADKLFKLMWLLAIAIVGVGTVVMSLTVFTMDDIVAKIVATTAILIMTVIASILTFTTVKSLR